MYQSIIAAVLFAISATCVANTSATDEESEFTSTRNFPVIIDNQIITQGTCRLSFENGTTLDVPCKTDSSAFASI